MDESEEHLACIAVELSLVPGVGTLTQAGLWKASSGLHGVSSMDGSALESLGLAAEAREAIQSRRYRSMAEEILDWARREHCRIVRRGGEDYPAMLHEIFDPPLVLYCRGNLDLMGRPGVAIVGTRRPTFYGSQVAQGLGFDLGRRGLAIISGLARGIDGAAHRGCLEAGGSTIAVLGCGIDIVYPREHSQLSAQIVEQGLLLTEFPPGTSPAPQNFPVRNRIISGLAMGTVIVEASEYSGSLITARLAMEQNREVFAVPGNLTSPQSFGPNFLIKQGAKLVQTWRDVVEELHAEVRHEILSREGLRPRKEQELDLSTPEESNILGMLRCDQATQFDRLLHGSGMSVPRLSELLLNLEMRGHIRQVPGNLFIRIMQRGE